MRYFLVLMAALCLASPSMAQEVLPFGVTLDGQEAVITDKSTIYASIEKPVTSGAAMAVDGREGQVIVNIFPTDESGKAAAGAQPLILLFDASEKKSISENMSGQAPKPGWYLANVVNGDGTSRVLFQVK